MNEWDEEQEISVTLAVSGMRSALESVLKAAEKGDWSAAADALKKCEEQAQGYAYGLPQGGSLDELKKAVAAKDAARVKAEIAKLLKALDEKQGYPTPKALGEERQSLAGELARANGAFEVVLMTPGAGNGFTFPEAVLARDAAVFENCTSFVNHELRANLLARPGGRVLQDICGVVSQVRWDGVRHAVLGRWRSAPPAGGWVEQMIDQIVRDRESGLPVPNVGLSVDVSFAHKDGVVTQLIKGHSCDVVFNPARGPGGGEAFARVANAVNERMGDNVTDPVLETLSKDVEAMRALLNVQKEKVALQQQAEDARKVREQMCAYLLDSGLAASKLPEAMQVYLRGQFAGRVFEASDLEKAIGEARTLTSKLTGPTVVQGPPRVREMFSSSDQIQAAVYDLLEVERDPGTESLKVHRLTGIRELYLGLTGDVDMRGAVDLERAQFQHTTSTFTGLVKNALNKALMKQWARMGAAGYDWWERVSTVEHFETLNQITWMIFGTVGTLPSVAEGAEYTELKIGDSPETTSFTKYGGYIGVTLEALDRDDTRRLKMVPRELAAAGIRRISALVAAIFTDNAGIGPTLADTGALFNTTAVTTAGGHANLRTTALSAAEWDTVQTAVYNQPMLIANETGYYGTGAKMAINPRYLLVPRALELTAKKILYPDWENAANIHSENLQKGDKSDVVVVPEWTDADNWAAACDPVLVPGICIGERFGIKPEVFVAGDELSPAVFMNDESRIKVRHYVAVGVCDFRPLHKSNV